MLRPWLYPQDYKQKQKQKTQQNSPNWLHCVQRWVQLFMRPVASNGQRCWLTESCAAPPGAGSAQCGLGTALHRHLKGQLGVQMGQCQGQAGETRPGQLRSTKAPARPARRGSQRLRLSILVAPAGETKSDGDSQVTEARPLEPAKGLEKPAGVLTLPGQALDALDHLVVQFAEREGTTTERQGHHLRVPSHLQLHLERRPKSQHHSRGTSVVIGSWECCWLQ